MVSHINSSGSEYDRHAGWLGSASSASRTFLRDARLTSTPSRTVSGDVAYAPFGETYASSGSPSVSFTASALSALLDSSYILDPLTFNRGGDTSYLRLFNLFDAGHFVSNQGGVEFHVDFFGATNPAHWPDFLFGLLGQTWSYQYQCTATGCQ